MMDDLARFSGQLLAGAGLTLQLTVIAALLACALALPLAIARCGERGLLRWPIRLYVSFFRGTPLLAQLFLVYYGSGQFRAELSQLGLWWFFRDPYYCALLTFVLNSTAYQVEILRGGLRAVPYGQIEAGVAMGLSRFNLYRTIILPNAYRIAFPALGNEIILLLKGSAVVSVITLLDVMGQTRRIFSQTFDLTVYLWAALLYLLMTGAFVWLWRCLEHRLTRHQRVRQAPSAATAPAAKRVSTGVSP
ncbi:ABC transporter permease [Pseudomonas sp.]|jgi:His/Glu/Gln/Arg/opine family amino acid ABC transporter permease subunit|uniref:ABC transporter permease n=1 Tax=Pseudomonas sp. TaxID=306 RepID=UPI002730096F|nr:ABC transporter permease subunit [Pseudomonas sp.]MDP2245341.1 ABC transporter permease subunit [Pseudomonas sp.]